MGEPSFGERLAHIRSVRKLSQQELAEMTGLRVQNISRWETDSRQHIRSDTLIRLAKALDVSADYLLGLTENPRPRRKRPAPADAGEGEAEAPCTACGLGGGLHRPGCRRLNGLEAPLWGPLGEEWFGPEAPGSVALAACQKARCAWCGKPEGWHARDCQRPVPPGSPCAACEPPGAPGVLQRWGMPLCQDCADEGDDLFGEGHAMLDAEEEH